MMAWLVPVLIIIAVIVIAGIYLGDVLTGFVSRRARRRGIDDVDMQAEARGY